MSEYEIMAGSLIVKPKDQPIYSEMATTVSLADESGGAFVEVEQHCRQDIRKIAINPEEWPALREAIDRMIALCGGDNAGCNAT